MSQLYNKYEIKRIVNCSDADYYAAKTIYAEKTPEEYYTNTNEIAVWMEETPNEHFEFCIFAIKVDKQVVGFCEASFIYKSRTVIIDYMCFNNGFQINTVIFPTLNNIHNYFISSFDNVLYFIFELSKENISDEDSLLRKLLFLEGYNTYNFDYNHCQLGQNEVSNFASDLFIKSNNASGAIKKDSLLRIIESIYKDYNLVWYKRFLSEIDYTKYECLTLKMFSDLEEKYFKKDKIRMRVYECTDKLYLLDSSGMIDPAKNNKSRFKKSLITLLVQFIIIIIAVVILKVCSHILRFSPNNFGWFFSSIIAILAILLNKLDIFD